MNTSVQNMVERVLELEETVEEAKNEFREFKGRKAALLETLEEKYQVNTLKGLQSKYGRLQADLKSKTKELETLLSSLENELDDENNDGDE